MQLPNTEEHFYITAENQKTISVYAYHKEQFFHEETRWGSEGRTWIYSACMDSQRQGLFKGLLAALSFGLSVPLISTLTKAGSPLALAGLLYGGSALALLAAKTVLRQTANQESSVKRQDLGMLLLLTLIGGIAAPICLVSGLALLSADSASLLLNLETVFTMGIALLVGKEHLGRKGPAAAALILAAAVVIATGGPPEQHCRGHCSLPWPVLGGALTTTSVNG
jgi:drug/metabolite transporter (DMT)-like permease